MDFELVDLINWKRSWETTYSTREHQSHPNQIYIYRGLYSLSGQTPYRMNRMNSRIDEIGCYNGRIAQKFDRHFGSAAAEEPVKFQSDWKNINPNPTASDFTRSCGRTSYRLVNRGPGFIYRHSADYTHYLLKHLWHITVSNTPCDLWHLNISTIVRSHATYTVISFYFIFIIFFFFFFFFGGGGDLP